MTRRHIVWCKTLAELGRFPMYPDMADSAHIIDAEKLVEAWIEQQDETGKAEGRALRISFFSHPWERPSMDPLRAHPDSLEHKKAFALSKYGEFGFCSVFSPVNYFEYYCWVDFAGINQYNLRAKYLGVSALCAFAAALRLSCTTPSPAIMSQGLGGLDSCGAHAWPHLLRMSTFCVFG